MALATASVKAECNVARSVPRQGERSEIRHLLLCGNRKLLNAGNEARKTGMKGLKGWQH